MKILKVIENRTGWKAGLRKDDRIISINYNIVNDQIDYKYYISERNVNLNVLRGNGEIKIEIEKEPDDDLGIITDSFNIKRCKNKCVFCFIDQNPSGMRKSIYIKDEDYRLSFLYGNYITMTNLNNKDVKRIIEQRLSPLYVSVHAVDKKVRKFLLGTNEEDNIIDKIKILTSNNIELHGQVVLCPEINDGKILKDTVFELFKYYPYFRSLSVVPVGLTKFRKDIYLIKNINKNYSKKIIKKIEEFQKNFKKQKGENFVYPSDEFFVKANIPLPPKEYYDGFYQIENGVGLTRKFLDDFYIQSKLFPKEIPTRKRIYIVTGILMYNIIDNEIIPILKKIKNLKVSLIRVKNTFFGNTVTVSGLLTGRDIGDTIKKLEPDGLVILPPDCVNDEGLFLDDWSLKDIKKCTSCEIKVYRGNFFSELIKNKINIFQ